MPMPCKELRKYFLNKTQTPEKSPELIHLLSLTRRMASTGIALKGNKNKRKC